MASSNKRKFAGSFPESVSLSTSKKRKTEDAPGAKVKESPNAKFIYFVMTAGHELDTGSGYFYDDVGDSMSKETYDTQIVATFVNKESANQRAKAEAEMVCEDSANFNEVNARNRWNRNKDPTLFFHEPVEADNEEGQPMCTRVWVEKHQINYD